MACLFLYNWEHDRPTQVVRECAVAMYAINPALFHSVYKNVVAEAADGSEAYEAAERFWRACGFPGTCFISNYSPPLLSSTSTGSGNPA